MPVAAYTPVDRQAQPFRPTLYKAGRNAGPTWFGILGRFGFLGRFGIFGIIGRILLPREFARGTIGPEGVCAAGFV